MRERGLAYAAWASVCFFWGTGYLAYRIGVHDAPPLLFAGLRILAAGALVAGWSAYAGAPLPSWREHRIFALTGILTEGVCNGVLAWSAQWLPSGLLAILLAMTPFWMVGLEAALPSGERLPLRAALGMALGFGGLVWLMLPQVRAVDVSGRLFLPMLLMQGVCFCYAAGSILARRTPLKTGPIVGAGYQMLYAGAALTAGGLLGGEAPRLHFSPASSTAFIYLLLFGSVVGFSSYVYALRHLPVSLVALHRYINPVVAVLLGWVVLREALSVQQLGASALIFVGVILVQGGHGKSHPASPAK